MDKERVPSMQPLKIRLLNFLPFLVLSLITYTIIGTAWPSIIDRGEEQEFIKFLLVVGINFGIWGLLGLGGLLGIIRINLGDRIFAKYYPNFDVNHVEAAKNAKKPAKSTKAKKAKNSPYTDLILKDGLLRKVHIFTSLGLNTANFMIFIIFKVISYKAGSPGSKIAGILYWSGVLYNLLTIGILSFDKKLQNHRLPIGRNIIGGLSWGYIFSLPVSSVSFMVGWIRQYDLMDGMPITNVPKLFLLQNISYVCGLLLFIIIGIIFLKNPPEYLQDRNTDSLKTKKTVFGIFFGSVFICFLGFSFILSNEHLLVDAIMILCSTSYLLIFAGILFFYGTKKIFATQKLTQKSAKRIKKTILIFGIFGIIFNALPTMGTRMYTNPSLNQQFDNVYGKGWEDRIPAESFQLMRKTPYSRFDAYFGFDVPINAKYNTVYMTDSPRYVINKTSEEILSNGTDKYLNITHDLMFDAYLPAGESFDVDFGDGQTSKKFPTIIFLHGFGMERGYGNVNWTSQYYANLGYAVFDMSYGFMGMYSAPDTGQRHRGYDFPDTIQQIGYFTRYLANNSDYYHADLSNTIIAGRSWGGYMSVSIGWLYNTAFLGNNFTGEMNVKGILPYYPATDAPSRGRERFVSGEMADDQSPFIRGSPDPISPDYNPEWYWYDPLWQAENSASGTLAPLMVIQGTHDFDVPWKTTLRLDTTCKTNNHTIITAIYPFGGHGCDALHWSHYGQSIAYYAERFFALCMS